jgi:hypothetical protein
MATHKHNAYTVHQRLAASEARLTALEAENKELRLHLKGALETAIGDAKNLIQSAQAADFRDLQAAFGGKFSDLQASIRIPRDGVDGQSIVGPKGEAGSVTVIPESEMAQAVIDLRRKLKEQHAKFIAVLVENIEGHNKGTHTGRHFAKLLASIKQEIERLQ